MAQLSQVAARITPCSGAGRSQSSPDRERALEEAVQWSKEEPEEKVIFTTDAQRNLTADLCGYTRIYCFLIRAHLYRSAVSFAFTAGSGSSPSSKNVHQIATLSKLLETWHRKIHSTSLVKWTCKRYPTRFRTRSKRSTRVLI